MTQQPEFHRPLKVDDLGDRPRTFQIEVSAAERVALAQRFGLADIVRLTAIGTVTPNESRQRFYVEGQLEASVVQLCRVTLAPLPVTVSAHFQRLKALDVTDEWSCDAVDGGDIIVAEGGDESPEPIEDGIIDLGEIAAEVIALELDPFPRAPGVGTGDYLEDTENVGARPFAALAALKSRTEPYG